MDSVLQSLNRGLACLKMPEYQPYLLLSYEQFKAIFQQSNDNIPKINKMMIYAEVDFYNYVYNQTWAYKWYPLLLKFAYNCIRLRPTSFVLSLMYISSIELLLEKYFVFQYVDKKMFHIGNLITQQYVKQKLQITINRQNGIKKYKSEVAVNAANGDYETEYKPREWVTAGQKFSIYNPYFHWTEEHDKSKQDLQREFFIQNNQIPLLWSRFRSLISWVQSDNKKFPFTYNDIQKQISKMVQEFPIYKQQVTYLPSRRKLNDYLSYDAINQLKRYSWRDELKLQLSKVINNVNYFFNDRTEFIRHDFRYFESNALGVKPTYKVESFIYDFVTFSVLCIGPSKAFVYKKALRDFARMKQLAAQIK